jgi:DNA sulfur modification protein DndC
MDFAIPANATSIERIQQEYLSSPTPWYIGFSGGKDSSAVLKLTYLALMLLQKKSKPVTILYCDTGVEIPIFRNLVYRTLNDIEIEASKNNVPLFSKIVSPNTENKYFSKIIGRGYPPPSNKFRWCTDRLRINPINTELNSNKSGENIVLLGIRIGESNNRDNVMSRYSTDSSYFYRQNGNSSTLIFAPIYNYSTEETWATIEYNQFPKSIDTFELLKLYRHANGECPIIRDVKGTPCGKGRFGCWTCTVVRKDKSVKGLIDEGNYNLQPLFNFRNWLLEIRDKPEYRSSKRRNGAYGLGPFTLAARKEILRMLFVAQKNSDFVLIGTDEIDFIEKCWDIDKDLY